MARTDRFLPLASAAAGFVAFTSALTGDVRSYSPAQGTESRIHIPCAPGSLPLTTSDVLREVQMPELKVFGRERICIGETSVEIFNLLDRKMNVRAIESIYSYAKSEAERKPQFEMNVNDESYVASIQEKENVTQRFLVLLPEGTEPPTHEGERFGDLYAGNMVTKDGKEFGYVTLGGGTRRPIGSPELEFTGEVGRVVCDQMFSISVKNRHGEIEPELNKNVCRGFKDNVKNAANQSGFSNYRALHDGEVWLLTEEEYHRAREHFKDGLVL